MTALRRGFNWSAQHTDLLARWSVDHEATTSHLLLIRSAVWDRWQAGESMSSIGPRFDRESSSVFSVISPTGGVRPPVRLRPKPQQTSSRNVLPRPVEPAAMSGRSIIDTHRPILHSVFNSSTSLDYWLAIKSAQATSFRKTPRCLANLQLLDSRRVQPLRAAPFPPLQQNNMSRDGGALLGLS
jgi:hypothetical protein